MHVFHTTHSLLSVCALALVLEHVWFSCLVGWSGGLHTQTGIIDQMKATARLLLRNGDGQERTS